MNGLEDKVAVVTGGGRGLGRAIAAPFHEEGEKVGVLGRTEDTLEGAQRAIGPDVLAVKGDETKVSDLDGLFEGVYGEFGTINAVVANAAVQRTQPFEEVTEAEFEAKIASVLKSAFFTVQRAVPHLSNPASIVLIGSTGANQGYLGNGVYAAGKAGVRSPARGLSADLKERGVRVNCLSPGIVDTGGMGAAEEDPDAAELLERARAAIPLERLASPEGIAAGAPFLASDDSGYMPGADLAVDVAHGLRRRMSL